MRKICARLSVLIPSVLVKSKSFDIVVLDFLPGPPRFFRIGQIVANHAAP